MTFINLMIHTSDIASKLTEPEELAEFFNELGSVMEEVHEEYEGSKELPEGFMTDFLEALDDYGMRLHIALYATQKEADK